MTSQPRMLDDEVFYGEVFPGVRQTLERFALAVRRLKVDPHAAPEREALFDSVCGLLRGSWAVCGDPPSHEVWGDISALHGAIERYRGVLARHMDPAAAACASELERHALYYERASQEAEAAGIDAEERYPATRDFLVNVAGVLGGTILDRYRWRSPDPRQRTTFFDAGAARERASGEALAVMEGAKDRLVGWCSPEKAQMLYHLAREARPETAVEIGIYGGRSIVPIAAALRDNRFGQVYGIETWSASGIGEFQTSVKNDLAWAIADFSEVKRAFLAFVLEQGLHEIVKLIEGRSNRAHALFDAIQFLHIDGGHSAFAAAQDIVNFVPKVPSGGIIVFDDIDWASTGPGLELLMDTCRLLHVTATIDRPDVPGCSAFMKL